MSVIHIYDWLNPKGTAEALRCTPVADLKCRYDTELQKTVCDHDLSAHSSYKVYHYWIRGKPHRCVQEGGQREDQDFLTNNCGNETTELSCGRMEYKGKKLCGWKKHDPKLSKWETFFKVKAGMAEAKGDPPVCKCLRGQADRLNDLMAREEQTRRKRCRFQKQKEGMTEGESYEECGGTNPYPDAEGEEGGEGEEGEDFGDAEGGEGEEGGEEDAHGDEAAEDEAGGDDEAPDDEGATKSSALQIGMEKLGGAKTGSGVLGKGILGKMDLGVTGVTSGKGLIGGLKGNSIHGHDYVNHLHPPHHRKKVGLHNGSHQHHLRGRSETIRDGHASPKHKQNHKLPKHKQHHGKTKFSPTKQPSPVKHKSKPRKSGFPDKDAKGDDDHHDEHEDEGADEDDGADDTGGKKKAKGDDDHEDEHDDEGADEDDEDEEEAQAETDEKEKPKSKKERALEAGAKGVAKVQEGVDKVKRGAAATAAVAGKGKDYMFRDKMELAEILENLDPKVEVGEEKPECCAHSFCRCKPFYKYPAGTLRDRIEASLIPGSERYKMWKTEGDEAPAVFDPTCCSGNTVGEVVEALKRTKNELLNVPVRDIEQGADSADPAVDMVINGDKLVPACRSICETSNWRDCDPIVCELDDDPDHLDGGPPLCKPREFGGIISPQRIPKGTSTGVGTEEFLPGERVYTRKALIRKYKRVSAGETTSGGISRIPRGRRGVVAPRDEILDPEASFSENFKDPNSENPADYGEGEGEDADPETGEAGGEETSALEIGREKIGGKVAGKGMKGRVGIKRSGMNGIGEGTLGRNRNRNKHAASSKTSHNSQIKKSGFDGEEEVADGGEDAGDGEDAGEDDGSGSSGGAGPQDVSKQKQDDEDVLEAKFTMPKTGTVNKAAIVFRSEVNSNQVLARSQPMTVLQFALSKMRSSLRESNRPKVGGVTEWFKGMAGASLFTDMVTWAGRRSVPVEINYSHNPNLFRRFKLQEKNLLHGNEAAIKYHGQRRFLKDSKLLDDPFLYSCGYLGNKIPFTMKLRNGGVSPHPNLRMTQPFSWLRVRVVNAANPRDVRWNAVFTYSSPTYQVKTGDSPNIEATKHFYDMDFYRYPKRNASFFSKIAKGISKPLSNILRAARGQGKLKPYQRVVDFKPLCGGPNPGERRLYDMEIETDGMAQQGLSGPSFDLGTNPLYHKILSDAKVDFARNKTNTNVLQAMKNATREMSEQLPPALRIRESDPSNMVGFTKKSVLSMLRDAPSKMPGEVRRLLNDADRIIQSPKSAAIPELFEGNETASQPFYSGDHTGIEVMTPKSALGSTPGRTNLQVLEKAGRGFSTGLAQKTGALTGGIASMLNKNKNTQNAQDQANADAIANKDLHTAVGEKIKQGDDATNYLELDQLNFLAMHPVRKTRLDFDPSGGENGEGQLIEDRDVFSENGLMKVQVSPNHFVDRIIGNMVTPLVQSFF